MKVLFLDIDGVILPWYSDVPILETVKALDDLSQNFDMVVITSDWRLTYSISEIREFFIKWGFKIVPGDVTRTSQTQSTTNRPEEIYDYIIKKGVEDYLIVDDFPLAFGNLDGGKMKDRFYLVEGDVFDDEYLIILKGLI